MRPLLAVLPAAFILSACAQPVMLANRDCDGQSSPGPETLIAYNNFSSAPAYGFNASYEPMGGRFVMKTADCTKAQPPQPLSADPSKVGGAAVDRQTASVRTCPRSRA